ncbi:hypothetical protein Q1M64_11530 (plasmid) [Sinorhizobium meliloti]|nr:hypothetical protein Q1M64_11530 [Sinorhizobium meliloti]
MESSRSPEETIPLFSLRRADEAIGVAALLVIVFSILWGGRQPLCLSAAGRLDL